MLKTKEEIAKILEELTVTNPKIYRLDVPLDDEGTNFATLFLKPLTEAVYKSSTRMIDSGDEISAARNLITSLYIGGDEKSLVLEDFEALRAAANKIVTVFKIREANIQVLYKKK